MAPEQLAGKEVSTRSDIYSLGLVLYEVFTGKRAFSEKSGEELRAHGDRTPSRPSSVVKDLNPVIERVILRCLENGACRRVRQMFSASPPRCPAAIRWLPRWRRAKRLRRSWWLPPANRPGCVHEAAVICLAAVLLGLALVTYFSIHYSALEKMGLELTPEVLTQKSREMIARLGYAGRPADSAFGLRYDGDFQDYVEKNDKPPHWDAVLAARPSLLQYWYRQSPDALVASDFRDQSDDAGDRHQKRSADRAFGNDQCELDPQGRLTYFQAIPPQKQTAKRRRQRKTQRPAASAYDWNVLFAAAGLDPSKFQAGAAHVELAGGLRHAHGMDWNLAGDDASASRRSGGVSGQARLLLSDRRLDQTRAR